MKPVCKMIKKWVFLCLWVLVHDMIRYSNIVRTKHVFSELAIRGAL